MVGAACPTAAGAACGKNNPGDLRNLPRQCITPSGRELPWAAAFSILPFVNESPISNVSDTARWVAVYRAWETARADALFQDPFAERLAGERGRAMARVMPRSSRNGWPVIIRTRLIDDAVLAAVAAGCDCVVNLAAGFDTRPYRLALPASLPWVEADLPDVIEEKERLLGNDRPRCQLRRIRVDLADAGARARALEDALGGASRALVLTEGLLIYLEAEQVRSLSADLCARPGIQWWLVDLASPRVLAMMQKSMGRQMARAPVKFGPPEGVAFFEKSGWTVGRVDSIFHAAGRMRRLPWPLRPFALFPAPDPRRPGRAPWSGVVELTREADRPG